MVPRTTSLIPRTEKPGSSIFTEMNMRIKTPLITAYFFLVHCFFSAQTFAQSNDASAAQMREELMQTPCVVTADWYAGNVEKAKKISGDVIWSDFTQSGFMRFNNLPINNRTKEIYHLWIEDAVHGGDDKPMDGGRFDIRETGESIVPFSAKLRVIEARLFMVTVESPRDAFVSKLHNYAGLANVRPKFSGRFGPQESNLNFEGQIVSTNTIGFIIVESEGKK